MVDRYLGKIISLCYQINGSDYTILVKDLTGRELRPKFDLSSDTLFRPSHFSLISHRLMNRLYLDHSLVRSEKISPSFIYYLSFLYFEVHDYKFVISKSLCSNERDRRHSEILVISTKMIVVILDFYFTEVFLLH